MNLSQYDIRFKLFGVPVRIMPTFWLLCIVFSPFMSLRSEDSRPWIFGALGWVVATLLSFLLHEFGHALTARKLFGVQPHVELGIGASDSGSSVFGGVSWWNPPNGQISPEKRAFVSAAGSGAQIAASILFLLVAAFFGSKIGFLRVLGRLLIPVPAGLVRLIDGSAPASLFMGYFTLGFMWISLFWGVLNIIPVWPMDGGHILHQLLSRRSGADSLVALGKTLKVSIVCSFLVGLLFLSSRSLFAAFFFFYLAGTNWRSLQSIVGNRF